MTNEQAKSELMQIYMSLSEEKKKAIDTLIKASQGTMLNCPSCGLEVHSDFSECPRCGKQLQTCGTCRNEDTYHCAECENKSDYEQADGEYITQSAGDEIRQKNYDLISRQAVLDEAFEVDTKEYGRIEVVGVDAIDALSPVNPQPKVGHLENVDTTKSICSICGVVFSITVPEEYNDREVSHCPFCGCPMEIER